MTEGTKHLEERLKANIPPEVDLFAKLEAAKSRYPSTIDTSHMKKRARPGGRRGLVAIPLNELAPYNTRQDAIRALKRVHRWLKSNGIATVTPPSNIHTNLTHGKKIMANVVTA